MRQSKSKAPFTPLRWRAARRAFGLAAASSLLLPLTAGCSGPLLTFRTAEAPAEAGPERTGSIAATPATFGRDLDDEDWRRAQGALSVALDPQGNGRPVKWDNPESAMRGSVSPTGLPYVSKDEVCRDFLASVIAPSNGRFLRGTGCKAAGGPWHLRRLSSTGMPAARSALQKSDARPTL